MNHKPESSAIGTYERGALGLVFGGPVELWPDLARLMRVSIIPTLTLDVVSLDHAEAQARIAGTRFAPALVAAVGAPAVMFFLIPPQSAFIQRLASPLFHGVYDFVVAPGLPWWMGMSSASASLMAVGLALGAVNAAVFGGIPLWFLHRCAVSAAPAVSIAFGHREGTVHDGDLAGHPRVALAVRSLLGSRRFHR